MQPKISYTTYNKSSGTAKEFKEVGDYTVKAALVAGEAINTNYVIKSGAEPTDTFSITSDQTPKPKAVITQAFFDDPVTIRFVYDTTDYTNVPLVDAVYELTQNPSYSPNENASVYPPWHEYSKLGTIQKALFSASFKDFATFTGGATFNSLDL
ncbi:MAG: hypothetical protein Q4F54_05270 [Coriobacteriia bacterium]|nr:hypothetical protein [Coriobacteriia bacterium]